jgi:hypothetical protein
MTLNRYDDSSGCTADTFWPPWPQEPRPFMTPLSDAAVQPLIQALKPTPRMPVLFVGHGSPMNAIEDNTPGAAPGRRWAPSS